MAGKDDKKDWRRQRELEDEKEREFERLKLQRKGVDVSRLGDTAAASENDRFRELLDRAHPMIEQVNSLYNMFSSGAERLPPLERRNQLDQLMSTLEAMTKPTPALRFQYESVHNQYITYRDRWDKMMRDLESGKIKRAFKPGGGRH